MLLMSHRRLALRPVQLGFFTYAVTCMVFLPITLFGEDRLDPFDGDWFTVLVGGNALWILMVPVTLWWWVASAQSARIEDGRLELQLRRRRIVLSLHDLATFRLTRRMTWGSITLNRSLLPPKIVLNFSDGKSRTLPWVLTWGTELEDRLEEAFEREVAAARAKAGALVEDAP